MRAIAEGKDPSTTTVQEVLSDELETVKPNDDVEEAADLMNSRQIRRLPVVEGGKLLGMISLGDIAVKDEESTASHALEGVSEGVKASAGNSTKGEAKSRATRPQAARGPLQKRTTKTRRPSGKRAA